MKAIKILFFILLAVPVVALAQEDNTQPSGANQNDGFAPGTGPGFRQLLRNRMRGNFGASTRPAAAEEWDEAMAFLEKNSPNRYRMLKDVDPPETSYLRTQVLTKWRNYKLIAARFPELTDLGVQRYKIEDQIFGLTMEVRGDPGRREEVKSQVRDLADKLVHIDIQEEHIRVNKLKELLAAEQAKLSQKEANVDKQIDDRTSRILDRMLRPPGMRGQGDQPRGQADQIDDLASAGLIQPDELSQQ